MLAIVFHGLRLVMAYGILHLAAHRDTANINRNRGNEGVRHQISELCPRSLFAFLCSSENELHGSKQRYLTSESHSCGLIFGFMFHVVQPLVNIPQRAC